MHEHTKASRACQPVKLDFIVVLPLLSTTKQPEHVDDAELSLIWNISAINMLYKGKKESSASESQFLQALWGCIITFFFIVLPPSAEGMVWKGRLSGTVAQVVCGHVISKFHENGVECFLSYISNGFTQSPSDSWYIINTRSIACKFGWLISSDVTMTNQYLVLLWLNKN